MSTILLNKFSWEWFKCKMLLIKLVLLIKYSYEKIIFGTIELMFGFQNWLWKLKMSNFWQSVIKRSYKYQKILLGSSFKCKKLLNFTCTTEKFNNRYHTNLHVFDRNCLVLHHIQAFLSNLGFEHSNKSWEFQLMFSYLSRLRQALRQRAFLNYPIFLWLLKL